jgi:DNA-binding XRE family transcriptional regulator
MKKSKKQMQIALGNSIRSARVSMDMSQRDLARFLHVTDKTISTYEVGRVCPPAKILKRMSVILHKPLSYFDQKAMMDTDELYKKLRQIEEDLKEVKKLLRNMEKEGYNR